MIINETNKPVIIFTFENTINDDNFNLLLKRWLSYYRIITMYLLYLIQEI